jgi:D-3-phosphoglycerate dehydrogenase / 2-oxoglutarate reductase
MSDEHPFTAVQTESNDPAWFEVERSIIESAGGRVVVQRAASQEERISLLKDAQAVLVSGAQMSASVLDQLPRLELIIRYGVGIDSLDVPAATARGVVIAHYPDFCQPEVANHALMLLLAVARKLLPHDRALRAGQYRGPGLPVVPPITGQTLGIVALGAIGRQVALRARAFGMHVIAYDPYVDAAAFAEAGAERVATFEELLERADHISVHAPLTSETHHMFNRAAFARMKPTAILVNTARGSIVEEEALVEALGEHRLGGAGMDVFEVEPVGADSPLLAFDNVALTPHSAFYSEASNKQIKERVGHTVVSFMQGTWPTEFATIPNRTQVRPKRVLREPS